MTTEATPSATATQTTTTPCRFQQNPDHSYSIEIHSFDIINSLQYQNISGEHRIILRSIPRSKHLTSIVSSLAIGDILIAVNDTPILTLSKVELTSKLKNLKKHNRILDLQFINPTMVSVSDYIEHFLNKSSFHDLYGFRCSLAEKMKQKMKFEASFKAKEIHDLNWFNYLESIGGYSNLVIDGEFGKLSDESKALIRKGIPAALRPRIWIEISSAKIYRQSQPKNYFQELLVRMDSEVSEKVTDDIQKDLDRTYPEHPHFDNGAPGKESLRKILTAFAVHNPHIGYCQGLNFIAATIVLFLSDEDAFWLFATIIEKLLPPNMFDKLMIDATTDSLVMGHIVKTYFPRIYRSLQVSGIFMPTLQWFLTLYLNTVPFETALRIWDIFLSEGHIVLFRIAIAIFQFYEHEFSQAEDLHALNRIFDAIKVELDADELIELAYPTSSERSCDSSYLLKNTPFFPSPRRRSYPSSSSESNHSGPDSVIGIGVAHNGIGTNFGRMSSIHYATDIVTRDWINTGSNDEIDEAGDVARSAHRLSGQFFNENNSLTRMMSTQLSRRSLKKAAKKAAKLIPTDENIVTIRSTFRAVFDSHYQRYQEVMIQVRKRRLEDKEEKEKNCS